jgi:sporulation protein YlmC with PRC-barrel domain
MLKKIMAVAAVSGLALTSALAQSTAPSTTQAPTAATPAPSSTPSTTAAKPTPSTTAAKPSTPSVGASASFVTKQSPDQWLTSKFKGTDVIGADDKKIGDVSDILFDKDKKVLAYIVGVGGFLGIGAKDVAIDPASFQAVPGSDASNFKLRLSMTKDELKNAAAFEPYAAPRPVSSQAPATRPMGAPAPATPTVKQ